MGAERLVPTNNVCGTFVAAGPMIREFAKQGNDAIFSEFNLDSSERVQMPSVKGLHLPPRDGHRQQAPWR